MITFIICVKHYENCHSYESTWQLLENTLASVCNQTDKNFDVIVVSNKTLNDFSGNPKIKNVKFIEVDWEPPASSESWQISRQVDHTVGMEQIRIDRGTKYILALSQSQKVNSENHYAMFVDADDFIHEKLAEYINNSDKDFLKIDRGFRLGNQHTFAEMGNFSQVCGTSNITKLDLLKKPINFNNIDINSPQCDILKSTNNHFLKMIIGSHRFSFDFFKEKGFFGGVVPFHSAIYNCTHDEQHSGRGDVVFNDKCTRNMIKEFSIKTLSD